MAWRYLAAAISGICMAHSTLAAGAGDLDSSFGSGGVLHQLDNAQWRAAVMQSANRFILAGTSNDANSDFLLRRYSTTGSVDLSFGVSGSVSTNLGGIDKINAIRLQSNNSLVVIGYSEQAGKRYLAMSRYSANGVLDNTFATNGTLLTTLGGNWAEGRTVETQTIAGTKKFIVAGYVTGASGDTQFAVARYSNSGILDTTFGTGGMTLFNFGGNDAQAYALQIMPDARIVVAGFSQNSSLNSDFALARLSADGVLDSSFSGDGKATFDFGSQFEDLRALSYQSSDGSLLAGGRSLESGKLKFAVLKIDSNGSLVSNYGVAGKASFAPGSYSDELSGMESVSGGKLALWGSSWNGGNYDFALARVNTDASLDSGFNSDGLVTTDILGISNRAGGFVQQNDGKWLLAGGSAGNTDMARYIVEPVLSLAPTSLSFPLTIEGDFSTAQTVSLSNKGSLPLNIASITISGDFVKSTGCPSVLNPSTSCPISVRFNPTDAGTRLGSLNVTSGSDGNVYSVSLSGLGILRDTDGDGIPDRTDTDDDNDGVPDNLDAFPLDPTESVDTDHDGIGNNADTDDDNDGVPDNLDAFPLDPNYSVDTDHDGVPNELDLDDDNDGIPDTVEVAAGIDPLNAADAQQDADGDGVVSYVEYLRGTNISDPNSFPANLHGDHTGDGKADIFWYDATTGSLRDWAMNGAWIATYNLPIQSDLNWAPIGRGDFNRDGYDDVLWRNSSSGALRIVFMRKGVVYSTKDLLVTVALNWKFAGLGYVNSDRDADIFWQRDDGHLEAWLMAAEVRKSVVDFGVEAAGWTLAAIGDIDNDAHADAIWRETATGNTVVWRLSGTGLIKKTPGFTIPVDAAMVTIGDLDGDGYRDVLWTNATRTAVTWWKGGRTGTALTFSNQGILANRASPWALQSIADFDGDGKVDLHWRSEDSQRKNNIWLMNGSTVASDLMTTVSPNLNYKAVP